MKELILGLLGGGTIVQALNLIYTGRPNARQINAQALGTEVSALERTIILLKDNLEAEMQRHERERIALVARIDELTEETAMLRREINALRTNQ